MPHSGFFAGLWKRRSIGVTIVPKKVQLIIIRTNRLDRIEHMCYYKYATKRKRRQGGDDVTETEALLTESADSFLTDKQVSR